MKVVESEGFQQGRREEDERERDVAMEKQTLRRVKELEKKEQKCKPRETHSLSAHTPRYNLGTGGKGDHSADVSVIKSTWRFWHLSFATGQRLFFFRVRNLFNAKNKSELGILFGGIFPF